MTVAAPRWRLQRSRRRQCARVAVQVAAESSAHRLPADERYWLPVRPVRHGVVVWRGKSAPALSATCWISDRRSPLLFGEKATWASATCHGFLWQGSGFSTTARARGIPMLSRRKWKITSAAMGHRCLAGFPLSPAKSTFSAAKQTAFDGMSQEDREREVAAASVIGRKLVNQRRRLPLGCRLTFWPRSRSA